MKDRIIVAEEPVGKGRDGSQNDPYNNVERKPLGDPDNRSTPILKWKEKVQDPNRPKRRDPKPGMDFTWDDSYLPNIQIRLRNMRLGQQFRLSSTSIAQSFMLRRHYVLALRNDPNYLTEYLLRCPADGALLFFLPEVVLKGGVTINLFKSQGVKLSTTSFNLLYPAWTSDNWLSYYLTSTLTGGGPVAPMVDRVLSPYFKEQKNKVDTLIAQEEEVNGDTTRLSKIKEDISALQQVIASECKIYGQPGKALAYGKLSKTQLEQLVKKRVDCLQVELFLLGYLDQSKDIEFLQSIISSYRSPDLFKIVLMYNMSEHEDVNPSLIETGFKSIPGAVSELAYLVNRLFNKALDHHEAPYKINQRGLISSEKLKKLANTLQNNVPDTLIEEYVKNNPYEYPSIKNLYGQRSEDLLKKCKEFYDTALKDAKMHNINPNQYFLVSLMEEKDLKEISVKDLKRSYAEDFNFQDPYFIELFKKYSNVIRLQDIDYRVEDLNDDRYEHGKVPFGPLHSNWTDILGLLKSSITKTIPYTLQQQCIFPDDKTFIFLIENQKFFIKEEFILPFKTIQESRELPLYIRWHKPFLIESGYHEFQVGRRPVAWVRFTPLSEEVLWIDEIQSDLTSILNSAGQKQLFELLITFVMNFINEYKTKHRVKYFYLPNSNTKERLYRIAPPRSIYEDLPRKCGFKKTVFENVAHRVDGFGGWVFKA